MRPAPARRVCRCLVVWARFYARSFGKAQREARRRMLEYGFGA